MSKFNRILLAIAMGTAAMATQAATYTFVGSWEVEQGPNWYDGAPEGQLAYTGLEAAALLFGGAASDYAISTIGADVNAIDFQAWYDVIGVGPNKFAQDYNKKYLGQYYGPISGYPTDVNLSPASTYIRDNTAGSHLTNYAFRVTAVPEPESYALALSGLVTAGLVLRRKSKV